MMIIIIIIIIINVCNKLTVAGNAKITFSRIAEASDDCHRL
jgi:hypothetical protein